MVKVVNIGGGFAVPLKFAVEACRFLRDYFTSLTQLGSDENDEADGFEKAVLTLVRGGYPGNLRFSLLKGLTEKPSFSFPYNQYRRRQTIRKYF